MQLVQQRAIYDCVLACLTMATGKDYDALWSGNFRQEVEDNKGTAGKKNLHEKAFELAGLVAGKDYVSVWCGSTAANIVRQMLWGRRAFVQVPSLNHQGAQHYVFWDGENLHDPSTKQRYQWLDHIAPEWVVLLKNGDSTNAIGVKANAGGERRP